VAITEGTRRKYLGAIKGFLGFDFAFGFDFEFDFDFGFDFDVAKVEGGSSLWSVLG